MGVKTKTTCHHCGSSVTSEAYIFDGHTFCCQGCKSIYELFRDSGNSDYYKERTLNTDLNKYAFLDNYEIAKKVINFSSDGVNQVTLKLPSIHCSSCVYVLENLPMVHQGIIRLTVDFTDKKASIYYDPDLLSLKTLASLLDSIGYAPDFQQNKEQTKNSKSRDLILKIGVAGFCFGNIMLLSFPAYLGMDDADLEMFGPFFKFIMLLLAIPVTFYSGREFLVAAFKSVIGGKIHIDVPIALGIITLFTRSVYEIVYNVGDGYLDSLAGLIFFLLIGRWFQARAYSHLSFERDYRSYFPLAVNRVVNSGEMVTLPIEKVEIGHELYIRHNEIIPADSILLSDNGSIDYSFVTGENRPIAKTKDDFLYAGGRQLGGAIRVRVTKPCSQSYLTQLWNNPVFAKDKNTYSQLLINKVSHYFTWTILAIAVVAGVFWYQQESTRMWEVICAVLIVACPCALALATPFTNGNTLRIFGRNRFYLRNTDTAEALAKLDVLVLDKTGTLTTLGTGKLTYHGDVLTRTEQEHVGLLARQSSHPISRLIAEQFPAEIDKDISEFTEYLSKGVEATIENKQYRLGSSQWITGKRSEEGRIYVASNDRVLGYFVLQSTLRPDLDNAIRSLRKRYKLVVLSGDDSHDREWLKDLFGKDAEMHFNMSPFDKLEYIKQLQSNGLKTLMLGDGLNDAGALKQSNTGIAVTEDVSQFAPASDGILDGSEVYRLPAFLDFARVSRTIVILSFALSFLYNVIGLSLAVSGILTPVLAAILMPISSVSVVAFTTFGGNHIAKKMNL